jgi:hypothetical protein
MDEPNDPGGSDPAPEIAAAQGAGDGPLVAHRALASPATVDRGARTVEVVWSTGARARNIVGGLGVITEELEMTPAAVRMDALRSGRAPVLDTHRRGGARDVLGRVVADPRKFTLLRRSSRKHVPAHSKGGASCLPRRRSAADRPAGRCASV